MQCAQSLKTFVKLEFVDEKVFFIVTIPVKSSKGSILIMELLRDVTGQDVLGGLLSFGDSRGNGIDIRTRILELNEMAVMDGLTGLYNRRYLNEKLPVEMLQSKHNEKELSLIMLDIDHFKKVNDVYDTLPEISSYNGLRMNWFSKLHIMGGLLAMAAKNLRFVCLDLT